MSDNTKEHHPTILNIADKYVEVVEFLYEYRQRIAGEIAVALLALDLEVDCLTYEEGIPIRAKHDRIKNSVVELAKYKLDGVSGLVDKLAHALRDASAHLYEIEGRTAARADCHSLADKEVRQKVWELTGGRCTYCDCQLENGGTVGASFVVEHVVPRSCGGPDNIANYVPACASCNNSKGDRHVLQFIQTKMDRRRPPLTVVPLPVAAGE
jgi:hypothetical protein